VFVFVFVFAANSLSRERETACIRAGAARARRLLIIAQKRADVHDDPKRRSLAQPRQDAAAVRRRRSARPTCLAHNARANDEPNVGHAVVIQDANARSLDCVQTDTERGIQDPSHGEPLKNDHFGAAVDRKGERARVTIEGAADDRTRVRSGPVSARFGACAPRRTTQNEPRFGCGGLRKTPSRRKAAESHGGGAQACCCVAYATEHAPAARAQGCRVRTIQACVLA
jgi:hypothetical protein